MDSPASIRRRRSRRVPDANRKRAPRACTHCKVRKSRCVETLRGACDRCRQSSLTCEFERQLSTPDESAPDIPLESQISPSATFAADSPAERFMWPRFLSKLRETFSLDTETAAELEPSLSARIQAPRLSPDSAHRLREAAHAFPPHAIARFLVSVCNEHGTDSFHYFDTAQFTTELDEFYVNVRSPSRLDSAFICLAHAVFALGSQWATLVKPEGSAPTASPRDGDPGRIFYQQARSLIPDVVELNSLRAVQATFVIGVYLLPASAISSSYIYLGLALRKALALDLHLENEDPHINAAERELRRRLWWAVYSLERCTTVKLNRPRSVDTNIITVHLPTPLLNLDARQAFDNVDHQIANARLVMILDLVEEPRSVIICLHCTPLKPTGGSFSKVGYHHSHFKGPYCHCRISRGAAKLLDCPQSTAKKSGWSFRRALKVFLSETSISRDPVKLENQSLTNTSSARQRNKNDVETALKSWKRSLPTSLKLGSIHPRSSSYRATFHLYLNYYFAWIAMGKISVVARVRSHLKICLGRDVQSTPEVYDDHLSQACVKAAKKILRLYEDVRRTGNLTRFSFTDFQGCSVATSLVLLAGILERDTEYERHVNFGLDSLRKMAEGNATATAGLKFVEALQSIAEEAVQRLQQHGAVISTTEQPSSQISDYSAWADWLARQPHQSSIHGSGTRTPLDPDNSSEQQLGVDFTTWDGAAALQQLSIPTITPPEGLQHQSTAGLMETFDPTMFTTDYSEDTMFLMGLTGFDVMGLGFQD